MKTFCHIYAQWDQVEDRIEDDAEHLLSLGLVCDATFSRTQAKSHHGTLKRIQDAGGLCAFNIYPASIDPSCSDPNWWKYSEDECVRLLEKAREVYGRFGLGPLCAINTYTPGNSLVAACRRTGVEYILGFCAPTVIEDGEWEIAHYGSPLSPYFAGEEDFRKPENPGSRRDALMIAAMELRNPMVCLNHWSEGPWCPLNAQAADRWLEPSAEPYPFLQIAEDWIRQSEISGEAKFFHINLQYFFAGRNRAHNRRALEWLAAQRDKGRLETGSLQQWRERVRDSEGFRRQTTYWRGEMMGFHVGHRPGCFPDVIVDESLRGQTIWQAPSPLPQRTYDYRKTWDYPAFQPDGSAPASEDHSELSVVQGSSQLEITNHSPEAREVRLIAWNAAPGLQSPVTSESLTPGWEAEFVSHPTGINGALLLSGIAQPGRTIVRFAVEGGFSPVTTHRSWSHLVEAQTFFSGRTPYTVLAAQVPEPFEVRARIHQPCSESEPVIVERLCGLEYEKREMPCLSMPLAFDGSKLACWYRFWGVTADQIELTGTEEAQHGLRRRMADKVAAIAPGTVVPEPGYQTFGNIRDTSRWDRTFARAAGDRELRQISTWYADQRPEIGEALISAHPGLYLPRGSITKVLGHEFDRIDCAPGVSFRELCADYPQGWDWGVAGWVQWRHLKVELRGLKPGRKHSVHLHAFDPEGRDITQRVHLFNPADRTEEGLDICAVREWTLPVGLEGRFHPDALRSFVIPEICLSWEAIGLWIWPLEKGRLYDWVAERGAPGVLSHLWVTREPSPGSA